MQLMIVSVMLDIIMTQVNQNALNVFIMGTQLKKPIKYVNCLTIKVYIQQEQEFAKVLFLILMILIIINVYLVRLVNIQMKEKNVIIVIVQITNVI